MSWVCPICGVRHPDDLPLCFAAEAPCYFLVREDEFDDRVVLDADRCSVDDEHFFVRGEIRLPIIGDDRTLSLVVWSSLSERSFEHLCARWDEPWATIHRTSAGSAPVFPFTRRPCT